LSAESADALGWPAFNIDIAGVALYAFASLALN
jgi:hypothetical protein